MWQLGDTHKTPSESEAQAHQLSAQQLKTQQSALPTDTAWAAFENHTLSPDLLTLAIF